MSDSDLNILIDRLSQRALVSDEDKAALAALPSVRRILNQNTYLVREGEMPRACCSIVLSGLAYRHKLAHDGKRQIVSIHLTGDLLDLEHLFLNVADHSVQALTELMILDIDRAALQEMALTRPSIGRALWVDGLIDASIAREWVLNVGRRDGRARIAHILCELAVRMRAAGVLDSVSFQLPMTQEQLGDATGMTGVHVNRMVKSLAADGLIEHSGRTIAIRDWKGICREGDFNPLYLHLDQVAPRFDVPLTALFNETMH